MKKLIALLCTLCMIATMAPVAVMAEDAVVINSWDGSAAPVLADNGFEITPKTMVDLQFPTDGMGGNYGPYMQFSTVADEVSRDEALLHTNGKLAFDKQYVAFNLNVYGKALKDMYSRYTGIVKPYVAGDINTYLTDNAWNNVFVVFNSQTMTSDLYVNGKYISTQNFYEYVEKLGEKEGIETTVDRENNKWTFLAEGAEKPDEGTFKLTDVRFRFVRHSTNAYNWSIDDLCVVTSDSAIAPPTGAAITAGSDVSVNEADKLIKINSATANISAPGAMILINGDAGSEVKEGDEVVVITSTPYGNLYSATYTVVPMTAASVSVYDASALKKDFYTDAQGSKLADLDDVWKVANINEGIKAGVTEPLGGKADDGYLQFSGFGELSISGQNKYNTRYFALSINVYGQNLRDIWSRLASSSNKVSLVAEGYKPGGHLTSSLMADVWNNVFFVFDSQTKVTKTYINGKYFKSANLYNTVEKALGGTADRTAGTATANEANINADYMNLKNDIRFLFPTDTTVSLDDIALLYADYEPAPAPMTEIAVEGAKVSGNNIFMDEGAETATITAEGATVLVDSGEGYAEGNEIKADDKVLIINETPYGDIYQNYIVTTPVYGSYEAFGKPDAKWSYAAGVLTVYGSGEMPAVADSGETGYANRPWQEYADDITKVVVEEGITKIAPKSFMLLSNLREVSIPGTASTVGGYAFQGCGKLDNVVFPEGVVSIEQHVFHSANAVKTITLPSTFGAGAAAVFNSKANTIATINVPWYGTKAIAWAENYKATKNADAVINVSDDCKEGYLADTDGVEKAFKWEIVPETGTLTIGKTDVESNGKIQTFTDHVPGKPVELLAPWHYVALNGKITSIVVGEGIKHIPSQVLRENGAYTTVTLPSTLTTASSFVFNAAKVSELYIKEGANFSGAHMINDNGDVQKIIFPSTMTPHKELIRDFTFGTRKNMKDKDIVIVAPYASPAYAWAQERYAEAVAGVAGEYNGIAPENLTIKASYEITGNSDGVVTVANNTGYAVDSVYVIVAYYDDAECTKLSTVKISEAQTLADAVNEISIEAVDGKIAKAFLSNGLLQIKPMAAVYAE